MEKSTVYFTDFRCKVGTSQLDKLKKLGEVLAFNQKVTEYFAAEYKFNTIISDIYKIIGDASELNMGFLEKE